ncbi:hypothetical protein L7F22_059998 [Adiantum nelumboides]|nr:hypothetical protein [Adiantum nelumboides]
MLHRLLPSRVGAAAFTPAAVGAGSTTICTRGQAYAGAFACEGKPATAAPLSRSPCLASIALAGDLRNRASIAMNTYWGYFDGVEIKQTVLGAISTELLMLLHARAQAVASYELPLPTPCCQFLHASVASPVLPMVQAPRGSQFVADIQEQGHHSLVALASQPYHLAAASRPTRASTSRPGSSSRKVGSELK